MISRKARAIDHVPPLKNGDRMTAKEFCRRWDATPQLKYAELIAGKVYLGQRRFHVEFHGVPYGRIVVWLGHYSIANRSVKTAARCSVFLGPGDIPAPDAVARIDSDLGASRIIRGFVHGPPELLIEVCDRSIVRDLALKKRQYAKFGVQEYLVWVVRKREFVWFELQAGAYVELDQPRSGIIKSPVFPGLWLDTKGMLTDNWPKTLATLRKGMESPEYVEFAKRLKSQGRRKRKS